MPEARQCRPCEIGWALIALAAAGALFYLAADILWDVPLPAWLTGAPRRLASVSPLVPSGGEAGEGAE